MSTTTTEVPGAMHDDSTAPGWSVNRGRPLWFGHPSGDRRQVMRLGRGNPDGGFLASILITTVSAAWTRQRVGEHLDKNALKPGVRLLNLTPADMEALSCFAQLALGHLASAADDPERCAVCPDCPKGSCDMGCYQEHGCTLADH